MGWKVREGRLFRDKVTGAVGVVLHVDRGGSVEFAYIAGVKPWMGRPPVKGIASREHMKRTKEPFCWPLCPL